jgi:hypothetical protein
VFLISLIRATWPAHLIIPITYPLHVSAPTGHLQVDYIYKLFRKELFFCNGSIVRAFSYPLYIFFSFIFWQFFAIVSLYVVDIIAYYTITLFEYLSLYIKTDKIDLIKVTLCRYFSIKYCLLKMSSTYKMLKY